MESGSSRTTLEGSGNLNLFAEKLSWVGWDSFSEPLISKADGWELKCFI